MQWTTVKLIFLRELRDQCRDRRTLFMLLVLPLLLYPALGFGLIQLTLRFGQETRRIGVMGVDQMPDTPPLFDESGGFFHKSLFTDVGNQPLYRILTGDFSKEDLTANRVDALIQFPQGFAETIRNGGQASVTVLHNSTNDQSRHAYLVTLELLERWEKKIVAQRMAEIGKPAVFAHPIKIESGQSDVATVKERSGSAWGKVFPFVLVIMALTGAFYPAVDLCAGEKERGTMETLLITPALRSEIVLGKFLTILSLSVASTVLNLLSMGLTLGQLARLIPSDAENSAEAFAPPTVDAVLWMFVLMLPLAAFFSALCMALAVFARSTKEGQYYMMPMFLVVTPLVFLTLVPGVQLDLFYSLIPVTNVALLLRAFMLNQYELAMMFLLPVLIPTALYGFLALRFAVDQFHREDVLFREAERFELHLWIRHLLRDKEPLPSSFQAWTLFVVMMVLNWYMQYFVQPSLASIVASQLVVIGFVPLVFALLLTSQPGETLSIRLPKWLPAGVGLLLVVTLHPVILQLSQVIQQLFPVPDEISRAMQQLFQGKTLSAKLVVLALVPAVCEEIAFRGFILKGLLQKHSPWAAILISSVLFGVMHMISAQMLVASMLGIVLGLLVTRTGSLFPGIVFHAMHNGLMVYRDHYRGELLASDLSSAEQFQLLVMGALASAVLVGFLAALPVRDTTGRRPEDYSSFRI